MKKSAFTMIEVLVVIAIIAILAAITFPVLARAKEAAFRGSDMQNMNAIRTALQLYRMDQGAYPPQLLGYATLYTTGPNAGQIMPANEIHSYLYPRRVGGIDMFKPHNERSPKTATTTAVWPNQDPRPVGSAPIFDANGDGAITSADDNGCARQLYGPSDTVMRRDPNGPGFIPAEFYKISGYDVAQVRVPGGNRSELRYALFWSGWGLGDTSCSPSGTPGHAFDDPRQLGYFDPPDDTVITWNSYFRMYDRDGIPERHKLDTILTLGGAARPFESRTMSEQSWRVKNN